MVGETTLGGQHTMAPCGRLTHIHSYHVRVEYAVCDVKCIVTATLATTVRGFIVDRRS